MGQKFTQNMTSFGLIQLEHDSAKCDCENGDHEDHYYYALQELGENLLYKLALQNDFRVCAFLSQKSIQVKQREETEIIQDILESRLQDSTVWRLYSKK